MCRMDDDILLCCLLLGFFEEVEVDESSKGTVPVVFLNVELDESRIGSSRIENLAWVCDVLLESREVENEVRWGVRDRVSGRPKVENGW